MKGLGTLKAKASFPTSIMHRIVIPAREIYSIYIPMRGELLWRYFNISSCVCYMNFALGGHNPEPSQASPRPG